MPHSLTLPPSPHSSAPPTLNPWTHGKVPNNPYGVGVARPLATKTPASISSTLPENRICFPYLQKSGSRLALQLDITLETIPLLRHNTTPPLNAISRLTTVFRTPQKRLMSSGQPSPGPPFLRPWPVCPFACLPVCPGAGCGVVDCTQQVPGGASWCNRIAISRRGG